MQDMTKISKRRLINTLFIICHLSIGASLLTACSMMREDRSDCPDCRNPLRITLRYDYNIQRANMFSDHVEEATVYVVDEATGTVVDTQTAQNTSLSQPLRDPSFAFNFEGLAAGKYRLYATGRSKADSPISITTPDIAESMSKLHFSLPTNSGGPAGVSEPSIAIPALRLDTVWNTQAPVSITVPENEPVEATVGLMRLTNDLNVIVFRRDTPADNSHDRYQVIVTDEYTGLDENSNPSELHPVVYSPFASWTTETQVDNADGESYVAERNAHYDLSLARLISHDDARQNPRLIIRSRESGRDIVNIDLCYYLALARNAYELQHYGQQEYLDREYDYRLDFGIEGSGPSETWKYMTISINVLSWSIRIQNEDL